MEPRPEVLRLANELLDQGRPRSEAWKVFQTVPPNTMELDELIALALSGLWQAVSRWEEYCIKAGHNPAATEFFKAYASRRMRGSMLDAMRSADWASRSDRSRAKQLREADQAGSLTEAELAAKTGLSPRQIRAARVAQARHPVSFDAEPGHRESVADPQDVESEAMVSSVLGAVAACYDTLDVPGQVIIAVVYHLGKNLRVAAEALGITEQEAGRVHDAAVEKIHSVMVRSVG